MGSKDDFVLVVGGRVINNPSIDVFELPSDTDNLTLDEEIVKYLHFMWKVKNNYPENGLLRQYVKNIAGIVINHGNDGQKQEAKHIMRFLFGDDVISC